MPFQGTAPAMNALLGGQVDMLCDQTTQTIPQIKAGNVKFYGVTTLERASRRCRTRRPSNEQGMKGFQVVVWHGVYAPKGTPRPSLDKINGAVRAALKDPTVSQRMAELGAEIVPESKQTAGGAARTCCGVSVASRAIRSAVSASVPGVEIDVGRRPHPALQHARDRAARIASTPSVFGMKPEAPNSMQRRITAGSSFAETTTTGTLGYCARRYIRPEKPRTPGMREIEQDQIDVAALVEQGGDIVEGAGFRDIDARRTGR